MQYLSYPVNVSVDTSYESPTNFSAVTFCKFNLNYIFRNHQVVVKKGAYLSCIYFKELIIAVISPNVDSNRF